MAKSKTSVATTVVTNKENGNVTVTQDIIRKGTNAYALAKMLSDGRRGGKPVSRKEIKSKLNFDPAPYVKMYACFVAVERGKYLYVGNNLATLK